LHGYNAGDVIITHVISEDAQTKEPTNKQAESMQAILGPASCMQKHIAGWYELNI